MAESGVDAYKLGRHYDVMPIPMVPENCADVPAGPVTFVVEARWLTPEAVTDHAAALGQLDMIDDGVEGLDDSGITVHVLDTAGRGEHLRFDCFENEPHYHYIHHDAGANTVVRFDDVAEADAQAWMLRVLRDRLPEMLEHTGAAAVAAAVRADQPAVAAGIDALESVLASAAAGAPATPAASS